MNAASDRRGRARIEAFGLIQAAQVGEIGTAIQVGLDEATEHGWPDVTRVLLYAAVVRAFVDEDPDLLGHIQRLHDQAHQDGDIPMLVAALAARSEVLFSSTSTERREQSDHDLARATALLQWAEGRALERATAYVACAVAYSFRQLWEIEEELYAEAAPLLAECEVPLLAAAVLFNRAETFIGLMCGLRELDDTEGLRRVSAAARSAIEAAHGEAVPSAWATEASVFGHLHAALTAVPSGYDAAWLADVAPTLTVRTDAVRGLLRLADTLRAAEAEDWEAVLSHGEEAAALSGDELAASARALALRLTAQAEAALAPGTNQRALVYAEESAQRRWRTRLQQVGSARAALRAEQLRIERDRHARAALMDELTGLVNLRGYRRHLDQVRRLDKPHPLAVLLVDIDHFKAVNDTHGHAAGDEVLTRVGAALAAGTRAGDLVARLGGDEFVVLLDGFDAEAARRRGLDLLSLLSEEPWESVSPGLAVSVSIGVAAGSPEHDPELLVRRADTALYGAKALGGGRVEVESPEAP